MTANSIPDDHSKWFIHYIDAKGAELVAGPYTLDEVILKRTQFAKTMKAPWVAPDDKPTLHYPKPGARK